MSKEPMIELKGVESDESPVYLLIDKEGNKSIRAFNEGGYNWVSINYNQLKEYFRGVLENE